MRNATRAIAAGTGAVAAWAAMAAPCVAVPIHGATLSWPSAMPFLGLLLTIAIAPMLAPPLWLRHYGKIVAAWSFVAVAALAAQVGAAAATAAILDTMFT